MLLSKRNFLFVLLFLHLSSSAFGRFVTPRQGVHLALASDNLRASIPPKTSSMPTLVFAYVDASPAASGLLAVKVSASLKEVMNIDARKQGIVQTSLPDRAALVKSTKDWMTLAQLSSIMINSPAYAASIGTPMAEFVNLLQEVSLNGMNGNTRVIGPSVLKIVRLYQYIAKNAEDPARFAASPTARLIGAHLLNYCNNHVRSTNGVTGEDTTVTEAVRKQERARARAGQNARNTPSTPVVANGDTLQ